MNQHQESKTEQSTGMGVVQPQSGMEGNTTGDNSIMKVGGKAKYENVSFADQLDPYIYEVDSVMDPTRSLQDSNDCSLDNFFSRPLKISEVEWSTSTSLGYDIDPWSLYFENPRVANRIANYNLLRCKLHVKIVINGNGFQYGRAMVSYLPYAKLDDLSTNAALIRQDLTQASQQPHVFLNPTTSTGGELMLPFYNYLNYIEIPSAGWQTMGQLYYRSLNDLKHANGASDVVTISTFAWAEDVSLSVLTSRESTTLTPQSGSEVDEANMKGIISGPATAVAKTAGVLKGIPVIAPFAAATEVAATATASVAKMFGYCRPPVNKNPEPYRPTPCSSLALTNVPDSAQKMTIDDKQELSIDPRIAGLGGTDPMNIVEIAKRESYLTTFTWPIGSAPETILWNSRVSPVLWAENNGPPKSYHFPACCMAAMPFKYWTGSMKFRFQIVASSFHKGRLKIVYDPHWIASNEYNTNYLSVIDIAEEQDFTIEIANGQEKTLLDHYDPGLDSVTNAYGVNRFGSKGTGNGVIAVYIVNELTTPNSGVNNDIEINVFVSAGDDFEVFVPDDKISSFTFQPQSGNEEIVTESQNTTELDAPQHSQSMQLGVTPPNNELINRVYTGEAIQSFRTLLKRYNLWSTLPSMSAQNTIVYGRNSMFPYLRGNVAGAIHVTDNGSPYTYCNTVLLHWVTYAFSGWRGSIRYKILPRGTPNPKSNISVQRHNLDTSVLHESGTTPINGYSVVEQANIEIMPSGGITPNAGAPFLGLQGQTYALGAINQTMEFEVPYYSPYRFTAGKAENWTTSAARWAEGYDYRIFSIGGTANTYDLHVAAGEDYQCYFWTGLPRMYYEAAPPSI